MNIKKFVFPSYSEWALNYKHFIARIGDYYCAIEPTFYGETQYGIEIAISTSDVPNNVYATQIFKKNFIAYLDTSTGKWNEEALMEWYEAVTEECNIFWEKFIMQSYFE